VHSGDASGVVPSSFRVAQMLLNRIENVETGEILLPELKSDIPKDRLQQAVKTSEVLDDSIFKKFPFTDGVGPVNKSALELMLNRTWRAALSFVGAEGLPEASQAGNVLRPFTTLKLSMRLPPTVDAETAATALKKKLEEAPPYGAKVEFHIEDAASGWNAPEMNSKLENLIGDSSKKYFSAEALSIGEGGTIPFMGMLGKKYPRAQFVITGVLGPSSNAHGPNEFIHLGFAKKLTACITRILTDSKNCF
jgi:acetylornithine deacetylase/succinyl-diaminopimelate desuccinylase-like protein